MLLNFNKLVKVDNLLGIFYIKFLSRDFLKNGKSKEYFYINKYALDIFHSQLKDPPLT